MNIFDKLRGKQPLQVDEQTGEITTMPTVATTTTPEQVHPPDLSLGGGMIVVSPEQAMKMVEYLQEIKTSIMKRNVDYGKIPGVKKDSLWKSGAQKLCALFNLAPSYELEAATEDPGMRWEYIYINKYQGNRKEERSVIGFYSYRVKCSLYHRETNVLWGTGIGNCLQSEKGKQMAEPNTLLKMAQKRAFIQVVLDATFSSELFTQDEEGYKRPETLHETTKIDDKRVVKKPTPKTREATQEQLKQIAQLMATQEITDKLKTSVDNFLGDKKLQVYDNAVLIINKLKICAPNKPKSEVKTELTTLMDCPSESLIQTIGAIMANISKTAEEEQDFYKRMVKENVLTSTDLQKNNKGALARCIIAMREQIKEGKQDGTTN